MQHKPGLVPGFFFEAWPVFSLIFRSGMCPDLPDDALMVTDNFPILKPPFAMTAI